VSLYSRRLSIAQRLAAPTLSSRVKDIYDIVREWKRTADRATAGQGPIAGPFEDSRWRGRTAALATLVRTEGSSYRRPGARMLIYKDGRTIGSLSAGCLEDEVTLRAREVLQTGQPELMTFDTRRRFGCAGKIDIFIECADEKFLADLANHLDARRSCVSITVFEGDASGTRVVSPRVGAIDSIARDTLGDRGRFGLQRRSQWAKGCEPPLPGAEKRAFIQTIHPPLRFLIFGDAPDDAPFQSLGRLLGWEVTTVIDPDAFPISTDDWTAAIVKSHNYGRDFGALQKLLPLNMRYVGLIGPRRRRDQLMNDLLDRGITINAGFFAPAGLDLGAETPEEIALSIISEIQRVFNAGSGESLRERKASIHHSGTPRQQRSAAQT
jgi:xanthine dehydrogenase accessory factor